MQTSPSGSVPRILRCPHCGAPLDAPAFAVTARCAYCGHNVRLAEPSAPQPSHQVAPPVARARRALPMLSVVFGVIAFGLIASVWVLLGTYSPPAPAPQPPARAADSAAPVSAPAPVPAKPPIAKPIVTRYPLPALLAVSSAVDIDGSRAHMQGLFPTVGSSRVADQLRYVVPLSHPWFGAAELSWKNERAGKLVTIAFRPPDGDAKLENQKEIGACLAKGLGKPEVREIDHLAGDVSYFWGRHFPKAWANLYSSYLWLSFRDPKGIGPITFTQVVRTLDGCAPSPR
jgi:DNA-directed RNA polymerase subunit RPC12/RpoP